MVIPGVGIEDVEGGRVSIVVVAIEPDAVV